MIGKLLKFSKGEFLLGQDAEVIPEGALYTVACDMVLTGFIRWYDGRPAEHKLVRVATGAPLYRRDELGHNDKSQWENRPQGATARSLARTTMYVPVMNHDGEVCTYTTNSGSGIKSLHRLLRRYATHAARHPDVYPLVKLKKSHWVHSDKAIGNGFYADFEPNGWLDRKDFVEALEMLGVAMTAKPEPKALPDKHAEFNDSVDF